MLDTMFVSTNSCTTICALRLNEFEAARNTEHSGPRTLRRWFHIFLTLNVNDNELRVTLTGRSTKPGHMPDNEESTLKLPLCTWTTSNESADGCCLRKTYSLQNKCPHMVTVGSCGSLQHLRHIAKSGVMPASLPPVRSPHAVAEYPTIHQHQVIDQHHSAEAED